MQTELLLCTTISIDC